MNEDKHRKHYDDVENHQDDVHLWPFVRDASRRGADELAASTFASTWVRHRFRRLSEARHSYHGRSVSHAPQPFLYLLFPYAIMPSPDACEQCVATLSRNEQKNARRDGAMARWADSKAVLRSCPFSRKNGRDLRL